ncbi:hypothetical protein BC827DRAFT_1131044, partial [Russula dissimulans]
EGDGQSERTNQNVEDTLRIFCNYQQTNWADHRHHPKKRIRRPRIGLAWRSKIEVTESCRKLDLKGEMMLWTTSIYKHVVRHDRQYPFTTSTPSRASNTKRQRPCDRPLRSWPKMEDTMRRRSPDRPSRSRQHE